MWANIVKNVQTGKISDIFPVGRGEDYQIFSPLGFLKSLEQDN